MTWHDTESSVDKLCYSPRRVATELINPDLLAQLTHSLSIQFPFLDFEIDNIDIINANINSIGDEWNNKFDTVIMNPPFGTKHNKGLDMIFLQRAIKMASTAVYSLHKTSTREHILKKASDWGVQPQGEDTDWRCSL